MMRIGKRKTLILVSIAVALFLTHRFGGIPGFEEPVEPLQFATPLPHSDFDYEQDVRPILDRRCVVCHACYDAPCQLNYASAEGIMRGASKDTIYDASRLTAMEPTRLFIDASDSGQWRNKGFFPVAEGGSQAVSVLQGMLAMAHEQGSPPGAVLPDDFPLDINRKLSCPADAEELAAYAHDNPLGGMPYGTAPLTDAEYNVLASWAGDGAPTSAARPASLPPQLQDGIAGFEALLNGDSNREKLAARYIYEHLFIGHLYFTDDTARHFFRLVRSKSPSGEPITEISTRHPGGDPGPEPFFYRLRPVASTIVAKTHIVYPLNAAKTERLKELFFDADWTAAAPPAYAADNSSSPFQVFAEIPARSRYQFMLDDIRFFIMTFIRGPVCRGQIALNVIDDHFFVAFLNPDNDLSVTDSSFLDRAKTLIRIPEESSSPMTIPENWHKNYESHREYLDFRENAYFEHDPAGKNVTLDAIWPGNSFSPIPLLTVFRHFDSASVLHGFVGEIPHKLWILDYPTLEQIYYNLVAKYDVFGNVSHQLLKRVFMDYSRMEAEDLALDFMPKDGREEVREGWYVGAGAQLELYVRHKLPQQRRPSSISYRTDNPARELMQMLLDQHGVSGTGSDVGSVLLQLSGQTGGFVTWLPDVTLIKTADGNVFTLIRNKYHDNVAFMFNEELRRDPDKDTLTVIEGLIGNYPNLFLQIDESNFESFVTTLQGVTDDAGYERFIERYGVRRTDIRFWQTSDWFADYLSTNEPIEAGLLDLSRYVNH